MEMDVEAVPLVFSMAHSHLFIASAVKPTCLFLGTHMTPNLQASLTLFFHQETKDQVTASFGE